MREPDDQAQNAPLEPEPKEVKELASAAVQADGRTGLARHFAGYELGLASVGIALAFSALAVPHRSEPRELPLPSVDHAQIRWHERAESALADVAQRDGLSFDVRAVGEGIRLLGRALAQGEEVSHYQDDVRLRARAVLAREGSEPLLRLRAIQNRFFVAALSAYESSGVASADLTELGGDFLRHAKTAGWLDARGRCTLDDSERRVLFSVRWAELAGLRDTLPFAPMLDEWRLYYRILLLHPEPRPGVEADRVRMGYALALERKDPTYPADFARGVLAFRAGDLPSAAGAFRRHLATHRGGAYYILAKNYLLYTLDRGGIE